MSWKYQSTLKKTRIGTTKCIVSINCDDWKLYERLVKTIEKELNGDVE